MPMVSMAGRAAAANHGRMTVPMRPDLIGMIATYFMV